MSASYHILICDDDSATTEYIRTSLIKLHPEIKRIETETNSQNLINRSCDILFIDIELQGSNGIDIAEQMLRANPNTKVIFISGYNKYAQDIFRINPIYFLQKPIKENMIDVAYKKALDALDEDKDNVFTFAKNGNIFTFPCSEILYIESSKRCCILHHIEDSTLTDIKKIEFYSKLNDLERNLSDTFIRCHQSYLVNMRYIANIEKKQLKLTNKEVLPISQSHVQDLRMEYVRFLGKQV